MLSLGSAVRLFEFEGKRSIPICGLDMVYMSKAVKVHGKIA